MDLLWTLAQPYKGVMELTLNIPWVDEEPPGASGDGLHSKRSCVALTDWQAELGLEQVAVAHAPRMHGFTG